MITKFERGVLRAQLIYRVRKLHAYGWGGWLFVDAKLARVLGL